MIETFTDTGVSVLKNPFQKDCVQEIHFYYSKSLMPSLRFWGNVKFKNGNTEGLQKFNGESFDDLAKQIDAFIKTL